MTKTEIAQALLEINAVGFALEQPVTFKSGIKSPIYVDNRQLIYWPAQWHIIIEGFRELISSEKINYDVIAGVETAGIPHSSALAYIMNQPSVFVRKKPKEHGTKKLVEGGDVQGKRVLLVEDLVTTGGSSLAGVQALRNEGAIVEDLFAIITYGFPEAVEAFEQAGVRLHTLTTFEAILAQAELNNLFPADALSVIEDWLAEPVGWAQRQGIN